jgi:hypothetical protein
MSRCQSLVTRADVVLDQSMALGKVSDFVPVIIPPAAINVA